MTGAFKVDGPMGTRFIGCHETDEEGKAIARVVVLEMAPLNPDQEAPEEATIQRAVFRDADGLVAFLKNAIEAAAAAWPGKISGEFLRLEPITGSKPPPGTVH